MKEKRTVIVRIRRFDPGLDVRNGLLASGGEGVCDVSEVRAMGFCSRDRYERVQQ